MKRKMMLICLAAAATALAVTGCVEKPGSSYAGSQSAGSGQSSQVSGSGEGAGNEGTSADTLNGEYTGGNENTTVFEGAQDDAAPDENVDPNQTYDAQNQIDAVEVDNPTDEAYEQDDNSWEGMYENSNGEVLSITGKDDENIQFSFAVCGISGKAVLQDARTAVYNGDDQNDVVFDLGDEEIEVTVCSREDYDNSESPVNGLYTLQY